MSKNEFTRVTAVYVSIKAKALRHYAKSETKLTCESLPSAVAGKSSPVFLHQLIRICSKIELRDFFQSVSYVQKRLPLLSHQRNFFRTISAPS